MAQTLDSLIKKGIIYSPMRGDAPSKCRPFPRIFHALCVSPIVRFVVIIIVRPNKLPTDFSRWTAGGVHVGIRAARPNGFNESFESILVIGICGIDALRCGADDILCMPSSRDCSESRARGSGYWSWWQWTATEEDGDAARNVWLSNMDMSLSNLAIGNCAAFEAAISQFPRD